MRTRHVRRLLAVVALVPLSGHAVLAQNPPTAAALAEHLVTAAIAQTKTRVTYDGSYRRIPYPGGDVPDTIGVCTDVLIRAYRRIGIDLQVNVHEDMRRAFKAYPQVWGMARPDPNIDHRRVPNLQTFFRRAGAELPVARDAKAYQPGDVVSWLLPRNLPHIGIVTAEKSATGTPLIVHNIGRGPEIEDMLFAYTITGHYRYLPR
jgi:uncharacterized protein YijF (DUF1287 family)